MKGSIFFFGGAFDPLTKFHEKIIMKLDSQLEDNDILLIGVSSVVNYKNYMLPVNDRLDMIHDFINNHCSHNVLVIEQKERTYDFIKNLDKKWDKFWGHDRVFVVIGDDEWRDLHDKRNWAHSEELLEECLFITIPRGNEPSSTTARKLLNENAFDEALSEILSENVINVCRKFVESQK